MTVLPTQSEIVDEVDVRNAGNGGAAALAPPRATRHGAEIPPIQARLPIRTAFATQLTRGALLTGAEMLVLFLWALIVAQPYLNMDPAVVPKGREYLSAIQTHHIWPQFLKCGQCAFWNGSERGGAPAFVDPHGSMLHPLVMLTTLGWGVLNGAKVALAGSFWMAGLAQWWLARVIGLAARMWSGLMAAAAGHLSVRMELGLFGVVLSTAACALVLPPLVGLVQTGSRRSAILLGVMLALAAVAGQGYMQIGLIFSLLAVVVLIPWDREGIGMLWPRFALAGGIAFLLAAPFLLPFLHFLPQIAKEVDRDFKSAQPFAYVPLNLVIADADFLRSAALHKLPYPHLNGNYIGWIPLLLALAGLYTIRTRTDLRLAGFFAGQALLALWLAHNVPIPWLAAQFAGIRHPAQIAGIAVPALLALAAIGLDRLLAAHWPRLRLVVASDDGAGRLVSLPLRWLLLIPMVVALGSVLSFGREWIGTQRTEPIVQRVLNALRTPDLQWVAPPFGEHFYIESGVAMGLKMHFGIRTWNWKDRPLPEPVIEANIQGLPPGMSQKTSVGAVPIYEAGSGREYAAVQYDEGAATPCSARGSGGDIDVRCSLPRPGTLTVKENSWSGWRAAVDGNRAALERGRWLSVELPAGTHTVTFRYRPWDVPLGIGLCLTGIGSAIYFWRKRDEVAPSTSTTPEEQPA